jgi:hypothetical protein
MSNPVLLKPAQGEWSSDVDDPKGTYRVWDRGNYLRVNICCPGCGQIAGLAHSVSVEGTVNPSLVCDYSNCNFHEWGKLDGWVYGPIDSSGKKLPL